MGSKKESTVRLKVLGSAPDRNQGISGWAAQPLSTWEVIGQAERQEGMTRTRKRRLSEKRGERNIWKERRRKERRKGEGGKGNKRADTDMAPNSEVT